VAIIQAGDRRNAVRASFLFLVYPGIAESIAELGCLFFFSSQPF